MEIDSTYILGGKLIEFADVLDMMGLLTNVTNSYLLPVMCWSLL